MVGKIVSHYKIIAKLGEGGMGVVYEAEDTRLDRSVALKFLPTSLGMQSTAKKRFINEAKAASSLEHPNICAVYDVGETDDGQMFIAMPRYDGETLEERLARGSVGIDEAVDIVIQVASGLANAHEKGIVHRDIKPSNIFITTDGLVKILDFGLAKLATRTRLTLSGTTVGTAAYMSPEQASGGVVDSRSDIFSLGVVLYELLTGHLPFPGEYDAVILYSIMNSDPKPLTDFRPEAPHFLEVVIERALEKNPDSRYQSALELRKALESRNDEADARGGRRLGTGAFGGSGGVRARRRTVFAVAAATATIAVAVAVGTYMHDRVGGSSPPALTAPRISPLVATDALEDDPQWSPSGNMIAFEAQRGGDWDVWVSDLDGANQIDLTASSESCDRAPAWSPDGTHIAFYSDRNGPGIYVMTLTGGGVRRVVEVNPVIVQWSLFRLQWVKGDRLIFEDLDPTGRYDVYEFDIEEQSRRCLTCSQPDGAHEGTLSPSGNLLAFRRPLLGADVSVFIENMEAEKLNELSLLGREVQWEPDGNGVVVVSSIEGSEDLWWVPVDSRTGEQKGEPRRLTTAVSLSGISFSPTGDRALGCRELSRSSLWTFPTDQGLITTLGAGTEVTTQASEVGFAQWLPKGRGVVYSADRRGKRQIWVQEVGSEQPVRLSDKFSDYPVVSPDGQWIAFTLEESDGRIGNYVIHPDGSDLHPLYSELPDGLSFIVVTDWSSDGRHLAFHSRINGAWVLGVASMNLQHGTADEIRLIGVTGEIPFWSPDGNRLVCQRIEEGRPDLFIASIDGEDVYRLTDDSAEEFLAGWSSSPSYIYYGRVTECGDKEVYRIAMDEDARPTSPPELWMAFGGTTRQTQFLDFSGDRAMGSITRQSSDICLIEFERSLAQ